MGIKGLFDKLFKAAGGNKDFDSVEKKVEEIERLLDLVSKGQSGSFKESYLKAISTPTKRIPNYHLYDDMENSGSTVYVESCLDMFGEDATSNDVNTKTSVWVTSENEDIKNELNKFLAQHAIPGRLFQWARLIAKYGDFPLIISGKEGKGILTLQDDTHPSRFYRVTDKKPGKPLLGFLANEVAYSPWDVVHFKLPGSHVENDLDMESKNIPGNGSIKTIDTDYGQSILYPVRQVHKQLQIIEDALILSRITGIRRNVFKVAVTGQSLADKIESLKSYEQLIKKEIALDINSGRLSSRNRIPTFTEDIFLPVTNEKDIVIDQLGGDLNIKEAFDVDYIRKKFFAGIRIPEAFMSFTEALNSRSTLMQLDARYAKTINRLQNAIKVGIYRLCRIHLAYLGKDLGKAGDFHVEMASTSAIEEEAAQELTQRKIQTARETLDIFSTIENLNQENGFSDENPEGATKLFDREYFAKWFGKKVLNMSEDELSKLLKINSPEKSKPTPFTEWACKSPDLLLPLPNVQVLNEWKTKGKPKVQETYKSLLKEAMSLKSKIQ